MPSHLDSTYLADLNGYEDTTDLSGPTVQTEPPQLPAVVSDSVTLPGGIVIPRKTLWLLIGLVAVIGIYLYLRRKRQE